MNYNLSISKLALIVPVALIGGVLVVEMNEDPLSKLILIVGHLLMVLSVFCGLSMHLGWVRALHAVVVLSCLTYAVGSFGVRYGFPYGELFYTDQLGTQWLGGVPLILPLFTIPIIVGAVSLVRFSFVSSNSILTGFLAALVLLVIDVVLNPVAAKLQYWTWIEYGPLYGTPLSSLGGSLLTGFIGAQLVPTFDPKPELRGLLEVSLLVSLVMWSVASLACQFYLATTIGCFVGVLIVYTHLYSHRIILRRQRVVD